MNYFFGIAFIAVIWFLIRNEIRKKNLKKFKAELHHNWGKHKKKAYYNFFVIGKYFHNNAHKKDAYHLISEKSKTDFDIDEIFQFLDRTSSKIGQQYLYFKLRTIGGIKELLQFNELVTIFQEDKTLSVNCQIALSKLNNNDAYYLEELINGKQLEKPTYLWLIKLLSILAILFISLSFYHPAFGLLLIPICATNMVFHYKNKHSVSYYLNGVTQLSKALKVSKILIKNKKIKYHFNDLSFIARIKSIKFKTEFIAFEKNVSNEFLFAFWFIFELIKVMFNIEYLMFNSFLKSISKEKKSIEKLFLFIGEIDTAIATASLKAGNLQICSPSFTNDFSFNVAGIYHPLIDNCIENNLNLKSKSMLLTGSNMSGKTTFIRTVAVNSILAQTLHFCFAKSYTAPFYKLYSSIRISDDLLDQTSYYLQEVLTIKELIEASKNTFPCLFVLDEIFKGTNTVERISGGKAILSYLNKKQHTVLVSTHDIELTEFLQKENYNLYHFSEHIKNEQLIFDHKLKLGKLKTRNAIQILEIYNYPKEVIKDAKDIENNYFS
ncbi:DNA mismatch repair protein MutS [Polaribacter sp. R77954]|uniref:MutS-related protein n=1 Tax=Polaribacter sp. R77954 TaxID=3093870 RepID=UPI0037C78071